MFTDKHLVAFGYEFALPVLQYRHTLMNNTCLPLLKYLHDPFDYSFPYPELVVSLIAWNGSGVPEFATPSIFFLLDGHPCLVFCPLLSNRTNVFKTQAIVAQVHYSCVVMVSSEPNTLHMKLELVFTTHIPIHSRVVNLMFFCPVTMPRKILLEFFTFGLIFLLLAQV